MTHLQVAVRWLFPAVILIFIFAGCRESNDFADDSTDAGSHSQVVIEETDDDSPTGDPFDSATEEPSHTDPVEESDTETETEADTVEIPNLFDGCAWHDVRTYPDGTTILDFWAAGPNDLYAVGTSGTIDHYDGQTWSSMALEGLTSTAMLTVWGSGPNQVFVGGRQSDYRPLMFHLAEDRFERVDLDPRGANSDDYRTVSQIYGSDSDHVLAVLDSGEVFVFDGASWQPIDTVAPGYEKTMFSSGTWTSGPDDIFVYGVQMIGMGGGFGWAAHFDGRSWSRLDGLGEREITAIWGTGKNDIYVSVHQVMGEAGALYHFDSDQWNLVSPIARKVQQIVADGSGTLFLVTDKTIHTYTDGILTAPSPQPIGALGQITALWATAPNQIYAAVKNWAGKSIIRRLDCNG